jgi:hypothetical protein
VGGAGAHWPHEADELAPLVARKVPAGQLVQVVEVPLRYVPAAQVTVALSGGAPASSSPGASLETPHATRPTTTKRIDNAHERIMGTLSTVGHDTLSLDDITRG